MKKTETNVTELVSGGAEIQTDRVGFSNHAFSHFIHWLLLKYTVYRKILMATEDVHNMMSSRKAAILYKQQYLN